MAKREKVPVSERAVIQRINRVLDKKGEVLKKTRGAQAVVDVGDYYILNSSANAVIRHDVNVEALAKSLDVLADYEELRP